ncbi:hypothetical protein Goshw_000896, partial [Gossypium schwendimanii]|nr:hypothetical protein [Gossypium schwendimanii]
MKVSKLTVMDVGNYFQLHASLVFIATITFTSNMQRHPLKILITLSIPNTQTQLDRGSYSCGKPGCNYVVHVNCVLEYDDLYKVIEDEKQWEELYEKSMQSSIISVIEVNEAGEATKIEHFSHQHCLVLADKMDEKIDRKCDGQSRPRFRRLPVVLPLSSTLEKCNGCGNECWHGAFRCG